VSGRVALRRSASVVVIAEGVQRGARGDGVSLPAPVRTETGTSKALRRGHSDSATGTAEQDETRRADDQLPLTNRKRGGPRGNRSRLACRKRACAAPQPELHVP
jgi:hypothetical protein